MVAALGLAASALGMWRVRRRRTKLRVRRSVARVDLAELKAMAQKRLEDMQGCRLRICDQRLAENGWLRLLLKVEPPQEHTRWWPWGVSLECPELLARRDAMTEGGVLHFALEKRVEGHDLESWLRGAHTVAVLVLLPEGCTRLEIGYYGRPVVMWDV